MPWTQAERRGEGQRQERKVRRQAACKGGSKERMIEADCRAGNTAWQGREGVYGNKMLLCCEADSLSSTAESVTRERS